MSYLDQPLLLSEPATHLRFVLKMHQASSLHYDFRLEVDGVLLSWVLRRAPSFDPRWRMRAIPVPDHDPAYLLSERRIPKGKYGAGPMLIADHGTYSPHPWGGVPHEDQIREQLRSGKLSLQLYGVRHKGLWLLNKEGERWFLQKLQDEYASQVPPPWNRRSVTTGRSLEEI